MSYLDKVAALDILRPSMLAIDGIHYRRNPYIEDYTSDQKEFRIGDLEEACNPYEDETCDDVDFNVEESSHDCKATLEIPGAFFRFIIGIKGETRRKIETQTGTKIVLPPKGKEGSVVVTGNERRNVSSACTRISLVVEGERKKMAFTHFLSFSVACHDIVDTFENFKSEVLKKCRGDGVDDSIFQNPKKLHVTLGVLALLNEAERRKAENVLHDCTASLSRRGLFDAPLNVRVESLEYMNDDPGSVDVLYGRVCLEDASDRLQVISDEFVQAFVSSGLMTKQYDRVKLHVTLMNTIFRKGEGSEVSRGRGRKDRECFDANTILKTWKDHKFGSIQLKGVHLSKKNSVNADGYYEPECYVEFQKHS